LLPGVELSCELALGELVAPVAEGALGELLDIALVDDGQALALVGDRVLDRGADETFRTLDTGLCRSRKCPGSGSGVGLGEGLAEQPKLLVVGVASNSIPA
jgi:hypothetical protein